MIIKERTDTGYVFENEYGKTFEITFGEANDIEKLLQCERLRSVIEWNVKDMDGDRISLGSLDMTEEDFIDEIYSALEGCILYDAGFPTEEYIQKVILDTAEDYGIMIDE